MKQKDKNKPAPALRAGAGSLVELLCLSQCNTTQAIA